ncbi:indole-3-glycerol phosphate synthase TrpC [Methylocapsa acidiphila]|uniref:indole-3-glycerol phosphate synthase TrpC n=1 Tax=Methylocapsa acidiphila TaxID=133552 RepID=UPI00042439DB|nr:indole-3-glycerol phosphate synthase TrpC [Methylocapsa acidiphila]
MAAADGTSIGPRLAPILAQRQADIDKAKAKRSAGALTGMIGEAPMTKGFLGALFNRFQTSGKPGVIADIRGASPLSKSTRSRLDVMELAEDFRDAGATCVSASPDRRFFRGSVADLATAKAANVPILCNDVVIDIYQIYEARYAGADAILLIASILGDRLGEFMARAESVALDSYVEIRDEAELELALSAGASLIAVNNRNLETLEIDPTVCERLLPKIPADRTLAVASGGVKSYEDIEKMAGLGAKAVRVGGALLEAKDPYEALHALLGTTPPEDEEQPAS